MPIQLCVLTVAAVAVALPSVTEFVSLRIDAAETIEFKPELGPAQIRARVVETRLSGGQKLELTEANIIVSGGRGVKWPENFPTIQALADALDGAMGASRAVDAGWIDHQHLQ